jgi:hypothetical protein
VRSDLPIQLMAAVADPDAAHGKTVEAIFKVYSATNALLWTWPTAVGLSADMGGNRTVTSQAIPAGTIADNSAFHWTVQAYNGQKYSNATPSCAGTTDNTIPPPPQVSPTSGFGIPGTPVGHVGDYGSVTMTSTGATTFVWELADAPVTTGLPAPGACATPPATGPVYGVVYTACASSGAGWNTIAMRATQRQFSVTAVGYSSAGTASPPGSGTFNVAPWDVSHAWFTSGVNVTDTTVPDAAPGGGTTMTLSPGGTSWVSTLNPGENSDGSASPFGGPTRWGMALETNGAGYADTGSTGPTLTIDMTHSFTAAVWVRPTVASSTSVANVAMGQDGTTLSGFMIGQYAGYWSFCMPHTQTYSATYNGDCAYIAQPAITSTYDYTKDWTSLIATWDAQAQQMSLYVNGTQSGSLATVSHTSTGAASGAVTLGEGKSVIEYPSWTGDILDPVTYSGILDPGQLASLALCGPAQDPNASCRTG